MPCLLIVDDSEPNRRLPALILRQEGWHTIEAADGASAIEAATLQHIDCVLLDLQLPDRPGEAVCAALRALDGGASLRIVAYTAPDTDAEQAPHAAGFDAVVHKPLSRAALLAAIAPVSRSGD